MNSQRQHIRFDNWTYVFAVGTDRSAAVAGIASRGIMCCRKDCRIRDFLLPFAPLFRPPPPLLGAGPPPPPPPPPPPLPYRSFCLLLLPAVRRLVQPGRPPPQQPQEEPPPLLLLRRVALQRLGRRGQLPQVRGRAARRLQRGREGGQDALGGLLYGAQELVGGDFVLGGGGGGGFLACLSVAAVRILSRLTFLNRPLVPPPLRALPSLLPLMLQLMLLRCLALVMLLQLLLRRIW